MAWEEESQFCPDQKDWNVGSQFWPDLNGLKRQMSVWACLEWLVMSEVNFGSTGMAWNRGSRFWHDWKERSRFWSFRNSLDTAGDCNVLVVSRLPQNLLI
jgi:hypothetical protein